VNSSGKQNIDGVDYYRDPPRDQLLRILSAAAGNSLRGLIIKNSLFWWESCRIGHQGAAKNLGADYDRNDRLMLDDKEGRLEITAFSQSAEVHSKVSVLAIPIKRERDDEPME